ncbi:GtrA family protein [Kineococcus aurantiacus]|uniref:Putative flippase GtrA n=1 Tax=Kineococcus aurantiacus TaxID=37633 RepID=A0A7Y9J1Q4_9ACTN|nr:putative flippase GtrA [Kineococcus aurantiacus]
MSPGESAAGASREWWRHHRVQEVLRFLVTGGLAYLVDVAVFNLLLLGFGVDSVWSKVVSSVVAIAVAFLGSRYYTWRDRRSQNPGREYALFLLLSVIAALLQVACLWVSHHLLGLTSPLADNISSNVVGMAIATVFRFVTFRTLVFPDRS